jgi:uncharacterized protein (TIGR00369 family)
MKKIFSFVQSLILKNKSKTSKVLPVMPTFLNQIELPWLHWDRVKCFGCHQSHPFGLKTKFYETPQGGIATEWSSSEDYEGFPGMLHGGILMALIDEVMGHAVFQECGHLAVSLKLETEFIKAIQSGEKIVGWGKVTKQVSRLSYVEGYLFKQDGKVAIKATGLYYFPTEKQFKRMSKVNVDNVPNEILQYVMKN